jgi:hypothetical protein
MKTPLLPATVRVTEGMTVPAAAAASSGGVDRSKDPITFSCANFGLVVLVAPVRPQEYE